MTAEGVYEESQQDFGDTVMDNPYTSIYVTAYYPRFFTYKNEPSLISKIAKRAQLYMEYFLYFDKTIGDYVSFEKLKNESNDTPFKDSV